MTRISSLLVGFVLVMASVVAVATTAASQTAKPASQAAKPAPQAAKPAPKPPAQAAAPQSSGDSRDMNLRAYVELLRSDVRSQKIAILTEMMNFTDAEDAAFWPIYREYDVELSKINDDRLKLIAEYAKNYENLSDTTADTIAKGALELEGRRHALKLKYYDRVKAALSPKQAARFLQVENQLLLLIDLQIASMLPVVE